MKSHSQQLLVAATLLLTASTAAAQLPQIDVNPNNGPAAVRINDPSQMGKKAPDVSYSDVDGRYFWKEDWYPALITLKAGAPTKMSSVRLNFYTNEIHFLTKEGEMSAPAGKAKTITVYSNSPTDSTTVVANFEVIKNGNKESMYQVMNQGQIQLLKRVVVGLKKDGYDAVSSKDKYHFDSSSDYFIRNVTIITELKSLSKSSIFEAVPSAAAAEPWLSSNKNKLKKPEDVAEFLTHLNSQGKL